MDQPAWTDAEIQGRQNSLFNPQTMPTCAKLHGRRMCNLHWRTYALDFVVAASQHSDVGHPDTEVLYETEEDERQRLSDPEDGTGGSGTGRSSSFANPGASSSYPSTPRPLDRGRGPSNQAQALSSPRSGGSDGSRLSDTSPRRRLFSQGSQGGAPRFPPGTEIPDSQSLGASFSSNQGSQGGRGGGGVTER